MSFRILGEPYGVLGSSLGKGGKGNAAPLQIATFESGALTPNPTGFDSTVGNPGDLTVTNGAAIRGDFGLNIDLDAGVNNKYGVLTTFENIRAVTLELLVDFSNVIMGAAETFTFITAIGSGTAASSFTLEYNYNGVNYRLRQNIFDDILPGIQGAFRIINPAFAGMLKMQWIAAQTDKNNGFVRTYWNNVLLEEIPNVDNDLYDVDEMRVGVVGQDAGTSGDIYVDNIQIFDFIR